MKLKKSLIAAALLLPAMAWAQDSSSKTNGLTYDYVGIGYSNIMIDKTYRATLHGTSIEGSKLIAENYYLFGNYFSTSTDGLTFETETLGVFSGNDPDGIRRQDGTLLMYYGGFDPVIGGIVNVATCPDPATSAATTPAVAAPSAPSTATITITSAGASPRL